MYVIQSARVTESSCICCCLFSLCVAADPPGHPRDCAQVPAHPGPQAGAAKGTAVDTHSSQLELAAAAPVRIAASRLAAAPGGGASWGLYCAPLPAFCPDPQQCCSILQRAFPLVKDRPVPMRLCWQPCSPAGATTTRCCVTDSLCCEGVLRGGDFVAAALHFALCEEAVKM